MFSFVLLAMLAQPGDAPPGVGATNGPGIAPAQERKGPAKAPDELLKAQLASARKVYEVSLKMYQESVASYFEHPYVWSVRWLNVERALSKKPADRITAAEAHLDRMKKLEAIAQNLAKAGAALGFHATAAEYYRLEAEIWLAKAKDQ